MIETAPQANTPAASPEAAAKPSKTILIVEDDLFLSNLLTTRFQRAGITTLKAYDGETAIDMIRKNKPDLVLLDIIIPKKSGFEVMEEIQSDSTIAKVPVIIVSNLGQEGDIERGKKLGAIAYFVKAQISIDEIINRVKNFLATGTI